MQSPSLLTSPKKKTRQIYLGAKQIFFVTGASLQSPKFTTSTTTNINNNGNSSATPKQSDSSSNQENVENDAEQEFSSIDQALSQFQDVNFNYELNEDDEKETTYYAKKYQEQVERSESLLKELEGTPLDLEALLAAAGQVGQQEFQFASFGDDDNDDGVDFGPVEETKENGDDSDDDVDFGDFQAADVDVGSSASGVAGNNDMGQPSSVTIPPDVSSVDIDSEALNLSNPQDDHHHQNKENQQLSKVDSSSTNLKWQVEDENDRSVQDEACEKDSDFDCASTIPSIPSVVQITSPSAISTTDPLSISTTTVDWQRNSTSELMSSASGRFLHRQHRVSAGDTTTMINFPTTDKELDIPEEYMNETKEEEIIEATLTTSIDWEKIYFWKLDTLTDDELPECADEMDIIDVHESLTGQLSTLDGQLRSVQQLQQRTIVPHTQNITNANLMIHDFSRNLTLAQMYHDRTQSSIAKARNGIDETASLLQFWNDRDDYNAFNNILEDIADICAWEASILDLVSGFECKSTESLSTCREILNSIASYQERIQQAPICNIECLSNLRKRSQSLHEAFLERLFVLLESITVRGCSSCSKTESLLKPKTGEFSILSEVIFAVYDASSKAVDISKRWARSIQTALLFEVDRSLVSSLLDPTDVVSSEYDTELTALNYQMEWGNLESLNSILTSKSIALDLFAFTLHIF
jgi:hypothetical protein